MTDCLTRGEAHLSYLNDIAEATIASRYFGGTRSSGNAVRTASIDSWGLSAKVFTAALKRQVGPGCDLDRNFGVR